MYMCLLYAYICRVNGSSKVLVHSPVLMSHDNDEINQTTYTTSG